MVAFAFVGKLALLYIAQIAIDSRAEKARGIAILAHKFCRLGKAQIHKIVEDKDLPIAVPTRANPNGRHIQFCRNVLRHLARHAFEHNGGDTCSFKRQCIFQQAIGCGYGFSLHFIAAHPVHGLRREAKMSDDRNLGIGQTLDQFHAVFSDVVYETDRLLTKPAKK